MSILNVDLEKWGTVPYFWPFLHGNYMIWIPTDLWWSNIWLLWATYISPSEEIGKPLERWSTGQYKHPGIAQEDISYEKSIIAGRSGIFSAFHWYPACQNWTHARNSACNLLNHPPPISSKWTCSLMRTIVGVQDDGYTKAGPLPRINPSLRVNPSRTPRVGC